MPHPTPMVARNLYEVSDQYSPLITERLVTAGLGHLQVAKLFQPAEDTLRVTASRDTSAGIP